ncbi:MAG TPA: tRNA pseudouridine(55) synthase TruB [Steroidobacteraceae bacterium]|nr:tRNA pseudouridine(55) synthase TruB [Steroidobacteraceae bacterium]
MSARRFAREVDGILLLDKPLGLSSNAALQRVRRAFGARKAGHGGSLDPLATGMLPLCFGQATKACGDLLGASKVYRARIELGRATDSGDAAGETVATAAVPDLTPHAVDTVLAGFLGERLQTPPMYSALKVGGRRLYELARRGETVEREPRRIVIHRLCRVALDSGQLEIEVHCSKGTYVRVLGEEIAAALGTVGHLGALRRERVEPFDADAIVGLDVVESLADRDPSALASLLLPVDASLSGLPAVVLDEDDTRALLHGRAVQLRAGTEGAARTYGPDGRFLGLVQVSGDGVAKVRRLFVPGAG